MARKRIPDEAPTVEEVYNRLALADHRAMFVKFQNAFGVLNHAVPYRATSRQLQAIIAIMAANAAGERITLTDIRSRDETAANINKSYQLFLEPSAKDPDALGWIRLQPDVNDGRKKYLVLTEKGREMAVAMAKVLGQF